MRSFIALLLIGSAFLIFAFVGTILNLVLYPYARKYPHASLNSQLQARKIVAFIWRVFVKYISWGKIIEVKYHGFDKLGRPGQLILANHPSLLDVVLIFSQANNLNCIVKKDLLKKPSTKAAIKACGFIPNTESEELLELCDQTLKEQALLIFPEGTRTGWDGEIKFHRGAVSIGLRSAKVITPVVIKMTPKGLKKGQPWYKIPRQTMRYEIFVGEDIDPQDYLQAKPKPIATRILNQELEEYFNNMTKE
ncbi:lysophospholipid acyltransferase family protein [Psittacicella gerlachiana]|uniref:1-acyl-sn-glycerol-3-phosphate acyltransferase n=1 Tax=Psittacicella gerlachiana TaxID=2028574 RepID=A0A3A1YH98_9GAMM|nr:lysophospholipid acyltransferase family protein [Psittacicella gerlachiana]RIY36836.1 1-acyl-sn-glycerol-3-phosphate acyltransferase [Psittacicella gerlachiana]